MTQKSCRSSLTFCLFLALAVVCCNAPRNDESRVNQMSEAQAREDKPTAIMRLLFIHHSVGGQWLADKGEINETLPGTNIFATHPNGGGLRRQLQLNNYEVHETAYGSKIGEKTDVCDWNNKFRDKMGDILACDQQDRLYKNAAARNEIVVFKSCYPNNAIESEGKEPGDPDSPQKSTANYKAAYRKLLGYFQAHPDTLFVCITPPPLAQNVPSRTKELIKNITGSQATVKAVGQRARRFNDWLKDTNNGWLSGYRANNVVVFDYYDILTSQGESDYSSYPTNGGTDSHPSSAGNAAATREFVAFLNQSVRNFRENIHR